jgi:hypothetical protein
MKSSTSPVRPLFTPVSLTLTFETQQELDSFGGLLNTWAVVDTLERLGGLNSIDVAQVVEDMEGKGAQVNLYPPKITRFLTDSLKGK